MQQCPVCGGPTQWSSANCKQCEFRNQIMKNTTGGNTGHSANDFGSTLMAFVIGGILVWTLFEWIWEKFLHWLY